MHLVIASQRIGIKKLTELKREKDSSTIIGGDFSPPLLIRLNQSDQQGNRGLELHSKTSKPNRHL